MRNKFLNFIDNMYEKIQQYVAWFAVVIVTLYPYLDTDNYFKQVSLGLICSIALAQLYSIKKKLSSNGQFMTFGNTEEAFREIEKLLKKELKTKSKTRLKTIGVSFHHTFEKFCNMFNDFYLTHGKYPNMEVTFKVPKPSARFWERVEGPKWKRWNIGFYDHFVEQAEEFRKNGATPEDYFKLEVYDYTPNISGFYIDDKTLFVTSCLFTDNGYEVNRNQYVRFKKGESRYADDKIHEFETWCKHNSELITYQNIPSIINDYRFEEEGVEAEE